MHACGGLCIKECMQAMNHAALKYITCSILSQIIIVALHRFVWGIDYAIYIIYIYQCMYICKFISCMTTVFLKP